MDPNDAFRKKKNPEGRGERSPTFGIEVTKITEAVDPEDIDVAGLYIYHTLDYQEALDVFHMSIPISSPEDFEITVHRLYPGPVGQVWP